MAFFIQDILEQWVTRQETGKKQKQEAAEIAPFLEAALTSFPALGQLVQPRQKANNIPIPPDHLNIRFPYLQITQNNDGEYQLHIHYQTGLEPIIGGSHNVLTDTVSAPQQLIKDVNDFCKELGIEPSHCERKPHSGDSHEIDTRDFDGGTSKIIDHFNAQETIIDLTINLHTPGMKEKCRHLAERRFTDEVPNPSSIQQLVLEKAGQIEVLGNGVTTFLGKIANDNHIPLSTMQEVLEQLNTMANAGRTH
ncbi:MAG: hypothetical protein KGJ06_01615 [Pseudomonadota bacterium]|nr:hypothetical protein [Pseudomonadota bacterium]